MRSPTHIFLFAALLVAAGCSKEPPPRTVAEFMENELLLEAALVRCRQNRSESRYEAECINAREAANLIEAREIEERRAELEAQSEEKREALRRNQEAAAEARRLAAEARQQREDAEYLTQFGEVPGGAQELSGNAPGVVISQDPSASGEDGSYETGGVYVAPYPVPSEQSSLPTAGSNAPTVQAEPEPVSEPLPAQQPATTQPAEQPEPEPEPEAVVEAEATPNDLQSIRDELRRRNDDGSN